MKARMKAEENKTICGAELMECVLELIWLKMEE